jgi:enamine deaminase RidA (YjgF/YER057c/UK114 family)
MKSFKLKDRSHCRVRQFVFAPEGKAVELHLAIQADNLGSFGDQLKAIEAAYRLALDEAGLAWETAVFRRFCLSDIATQEPLLRDSPLAVTNRDDPVAISLIEQAPLPASKLELWAYHVHEELIPPDKQAMPSGLALRRGRLEHLWTTELAFATDALPLDVADQTRAAFDAYRRELNARGATLQEHVLRTWIFVASIDRDYKAMTDARRELFVDAGLCADTHYLASTGIAGRSSEPKQDMILEGYAIAGIDPLQIRYLTAPDHLGPTQAYGVTFERGVSIQYGDRRHVLISGTASIDPQGRICHLRDVMAQARHAFDNVEALLAEAGCSFADLAQMIVYLRDPSDQPAVQAWLEERFPDTPMLLVHAPVCRPGWLIEVECSAILASADPRWPAF